MLKAIDISKAFRTLGRSNNISPNSRHYAVRDLSLEILPQRIIGLIGQSGCGKSTTALLLTGMLKTTSGEITYQGRDISSFSGRQLRKYWREVRLVFQNPESYFNPHLTIKAALQEYHHSSGCHRDCFAKDIDELLGFFSLDPILLDLLPDKLSIGQKRRISVLLNLFVMPKILIADEPFSGLDTVLKYQIATQLARLREEYGVGVLLISHDLEVVNDICDHILVMNQSLLLQKLEVNGANKAEVLHPYTARLILKRGAEIAAGAPTTREASTHFTGNGCPLAFQGCPLFARLQRPTICLNQHPHMERMGSSEIACHFRSELKPDQLPDIGAA